MFRTCNSILILFLGLSQIIVEGQVFGTEQLPKRVLHQLDNDSIYTSSAGPLVSKWRYLQYDDGLIQTISIGRDLFEFTFREDGVEYRNDSGTNAAVSYKTAKRQGVTMFDYQSDNFVVTAHFGVVGLRYIFWCDYNSCDNCAECFFSGESYCETSFLPCDCDTTNDLSKLHPNLLARWSYPFSTTCYHSGEQPKVILILFDENLR